MPITLTRRELYDRVWAEPIQKLAKEFGLSDVGLAKACRRHGIPVPPRGHWAKKRAGRKVRQEPLPEKAPQGYGRSIELMATPKPVRAEPPLVETHKAIAAELDEGNRIAAPHDDLRITHSLLRSTREYWRATRGSFMNWPAKLPPYLHVGVSDALRPRALRLLQALFSALEKRGYAIAAGERGAIQVTVLDETCALSIRERQRQVRGERRRRGDPDYLANKQPYDLVYTGELELRVDGRFGRQASVGDCAKGVVETHLNKVVVGLVRAALSEKEYREAQERDRKAELERERERARRLQLEREEMARIKRLEELVAAVDRHRRLAAFRDELRATVGSVAAETELGRWLDWIDGYLDDINVLRVFHQRADALTLYHCVSSWQSQDVLTNGFADAPPAYGEDKDRPASVAFADVPLRGVHGGTACVAIDVPEDTVLPYESFGAPDYRRFSLPARLANRFARRIVDG